MQHFLCYSAAVNAERETRRDPSSVFTLRLRKHSPANIVENSTNPQVVKLATLSLVATFGLQETGARWKYFLWSNSLSSRAPVISSCKQMRTKVYTCLFLHLLVTQKGIGQWWALCIILGLSCQKTVWEALINSKLSLTSNKTVHYGDCKIVRTVFLTFLMNNLNEHLRWTSMMNIFDEHLRWTS